MQSAALEEGETHLCIINNTGLLEASESSPHRLHFVHQYYRDYFAARYILNMIDAIETSFEYRGADKAEMYGETGLNDLWFGGFDCHDGDEVYRLIGEICGDYMNVNGTFKWTLLETLMDSMRDYDSYRTAENVIKTMSIVRNGVICDVNFRALKLPFLWTIISASAIMGKILVRFVTVLFLIGSHIILILKIAISQGQNFLIMIIRDFFVNKVQ